jgi:membrane protein DedA with SNARE-associated domain
LAIEALVARYGLLAILAGAGIEGEAVVITGGILVHRGLLPFWGVAITAAIGSCVIDQLWFLAGRYFRDRRWVQKMIARPAFARALSVLERHPTKFIFSFRFIYGLRTISPVAIGTSTIPARRFVLLNVLAAAVWGPLLTWIGYAFGKAIDPLLRNSQWAVLAVIGAALLIGMVLLGVRVTRGMLSRRRKDGA